jgi:DNA topoisomerase-2
MELPIKKWTRDYKDMLEEYMSPKEGEPDIEDIRENHTGNRVHFYIKMLVFICCCSRQYIYIYKYY